MFSTVQAEALKNLEFISYYFTELVVLVTLGLVLLMSFFAPDDKKRLHTTFITFLGLIVAGFCLLQSSRDMITSQPVLMETMFYGLIAADPMALLFKAIFLLATLIVVLMVYDSPGIRDKRAPEFYVFLLTIFVGMSLLGSGLHLLILYLGLEMVSLPSYVMAGYDRDDRGSAEAGIKYLLYGAVAGGLFLYGATLLYGVTGQFTIGGIGEYLSTNSAGIGIYTGLIFMLIGIGYKCSFFPMHMWVPDVYQGAPTAVGGFLSTAPKAAGLAVLMRMSYSLFPHLVPASGSATLATGIPLFFFFISAVTMTIGNLSALLQNNVKRLLGYSTIAHVGYMLMAYTLVGKGEVASMTAGFSAISFYLIIYTFMNLGAFLVVLALDREWLEEFDGMFVRAPVPAVAMAIFLFSLTGLPPLAGFVGKFSLFSPLMSSGGNLYITLAFIGVINSVISLFYYANVLKHMFLNAPESEEPVAVPIVSQAMLVTLATAVLVLGLMWGGVYTYTQNFMKAINVHSTTPIQTADVSGK